MAFKKITKCRICGNTNLFPILSLGEQTLTGVFPKARNEEITSGPLSLVKCMDKNGHEDSCGLLQLEHSYELDEMYGDNYGYRSGLNPSMVSHLYAKVARALTYVDPLSEDDVIIDIGSNDGTTLSSYPITTASLVGFDPTGKKFASYYPEYVKLIPEFFSAASFNDHFPLNKAKIITSFSMFYDLEEPVEFMRNIHQVLADDGVWIFEQSYMPSMLETGSFDTICHEHLEFYALKQIKWMTDLVGFDILDVELNPVNGGSFSITVKKSNKDFRLPSSVADLLKKEIDAGLDSLAPYEKFSNSAFDFKNQFQDLLRSLRKDGKVVAAIGASTKGNVLLQYCNFTEENIAYVGEVNPDKYGSYTPGSLIPIVSEDELLSRSPDYLVVLPWHFKDFFEESTKLKAMNLIFPLPKIFIRSAIKS